jgi:hypothetical protein
LGNSLGNGKYYNVKSKSSNNTKVFLNSQPESMSKSHLESFPRSHNTNISDKQTKPTKHDVVLDTANKQCKTFKVSHSMSINTDSRSHTKEEIKDDEAMNLESIYKVFPKIFKKFQNAPIVANNHNNEEYSEVSDIKGHMVSNKRKISNMRDKKRKKLR